MLHGEGFVWRRNFISNARSCFARKRKRGGGFLRRPSGAHWDRALYQFFVRPTSITFSTRLFDSAPRTKQSAPIFCAALDIDFMVSIADFSESNFVSMTNPIA